MTSFKRTQRKDVQKAYRVRNWREYETGLRARGSLTVWLGLTDGKLANWNSPRPTRRKPGRQRQYSTIIADPGEVSRACRMRVSRACTGCRGSTARRHGT